MSNNRNEHVEIGSNRIDFLGGTLDIHPINLILPKVVTINVALDLYAQVKIVPIKYDGVEIESLDYNESSKFLSSDFNFNNLYINNYFKHYTLVAQILNSFKTISGIRLELKSGSPAGAGLGGSSTIAITLARALNHYTNSGLNKNEIFKRVFDIEARVLDSGPTGYQDYYPALMGGVLALKMEQEQLVIEQLFTEALVNSLTPNILLVYSGQSRLSAINNWEVFKGFFNKEEKIRNGLFKIAQIANLGYQSLKNSDYIGFLNLIKEEGEVRKSLFPNIITPEIERLFNQIKTIDSDCGIKACGAGGGGCFILVSTQKFNNRILDIEKYIQGAKMKILPFNIVKPI